MQIPNLEAVRDWCIGKFQRKGEYASLQDVQEVSAALGGLTFGVDAAGNYGYYKAGADTVTPFKSGDGGGSGATELAIPIYLSGGSSGVGFSWETVKKVHLEGTLYYRKPAASSGSVYGKLILASGVSQFMIKYELKTVLISSNVSASTPVSIDLDAENYPMAAGQKEHGIKINVSSNYTMYFDGIATFYTA